MIKAPPTPKGFRDINPQLARKRRTTISKIVEILEENGFVPIETPTIEFAETLKGKYGEEERLIYEFKDRGGRDLALRYDLTVPLARYVATNNPPLPFRRYQIGQVFRGENPQAGRWREFTQLDFDSVGSDSLEEDALIVATAMKAVAAIGIKPVMLINDRKIFNEVPKDFVTALDKLHKIGRAGAKEELLKKNYPEKNVENFLDKYIGGQMTKTIRELIDLIYVNFKVPLKQEVVYDSSLARGLDYYTGSIFELKSNLDPTTLSIGAGGRYDNLIGMFAKKPIPAVGFSFGLDRLIEALK